MSTEATTRTSSSRGGGGDAATAHPCKDGDAGNVIRSLFSSRPFDFGGVGVDSSAEVAVTEPIDVSAFSSAHLNVRFHEGNVAGSAKIEVIAYASAPSSRDPGKTFQIPSESSPPQAELASVEVAELSVTGTGGVLLTSPTTEELGSHVTVAVRGSQGGTKVDCNGILSADLVLRRRSPRHIGGTKIVAVPKTVFDYTSLGPSASDSLVLARALDVRDFRTGFLALRVHERDIVTNARFTVRIQGALPDTGEPETDFIIPVPDNEHSFVITSGSTSELQTVRLPSDFGPFLYLLLEALQTDPAGALTATISLDFVGQE